MSDGRGFFAESKEAKKAGWFSRRHKTSAAHDAAQLKREQKREARREREAASRGAAQ